MNFSTADPRYGNFSAVTSRSSSPSLKAYSPPEENMFSRMKRALAFGRKPTHLSCTKAHLDPVNDFSLESMRSNASSKSQEAISRPPIHIRRASSFIVQDSLIVRSDDLDVDGERSPFLTSPMWFKAEFLQQEAKF